MKGGHILRASGVTLPLLVVFLLMQQPACASQREELSHDRLTATGVFRLNRHRDRGSMHFLLWNDRQAPTRITWVKVGGQKVQCPAEMEYDDPKTGKKRDWDPYPPVSGPAQPLWAWLSKETLQPGQVAECIVRFASMPTGPVNVELGSGDRTFLKTTVPLAPPAARISDINFNKARTHVYAYVENRGNAPLHIESAQLLGLGISATTPTAPLLPGRKRCIHFHLPKPAKFGERVYVLVRFRNGETAGLSAPAYGAFPIDVWRGDRVGLTEDLDEITTKMILDGYDKFHFWQDVVAYRVMDALKKRWDFPEGTLPMAMVNQGFIKDAVVTLGELVPCFYLVCEPIAAEYLGRYDEEDFHYLQAKARYIKEAVSPNLPWLGLRTFHGYSEFKKELQPVELRLRAYYLVSRGAKGLFYRTGYWEECSEQWRRDMKAEMNTVFYELLLMRDLLRIAEPVDHIAKTSEPLVEAATLLAGDKGIVLVLLNHDRSFAWPAQEKDNKDPFWITEKPDPITVTAEVPEGVQVKEVFEVGGAWTAPGFTQQGNTISFTVDRLHAARPFLISFLPELNREAVLAKASEDLGVTLAEAENPRPSEALPAPDIQFEKKQHFFKPIDPAEETVECTFPFRNVGENPLRVSVDEAGSHAEATVETGDLAPGEASVVTVHVALQGLGIGKFKIHVNLKTNDPNEPVVKLVLGGVIQPEVMVFPERLVLSANEATARITIRDHREGALQIEAVEPSFPEITCDTKQTERIKTISHAEVFRGEVLERAHYVNVQAPITFLKKGYREGNLLVKTNAPHHREIEIPVEISPDRKCIVTPSSLFFGQAKKGEKVSRACRLVSKGDLIVKEASDSAGNVHVQIEQAKGGGEYTLNASLVSQDTGMVKGQVSVKIVLDGNDQTLTIPYVALVR